MNPNTCITQCTVDITFFIHKSSIRVIISAFTIAEIKKKKKGVIVFSSATWHYITKSIGNIYETTIFLYLIV